MENLKCKILVFRVGFFILDVHRVKEEKGLFQFIKSPNFVNKQEPRSQARMPKAWVSPAELTQKLTEATPDPIM